MAYRLGAILIDKLTADELSQLCDAYDNSDLDDIFYNDLYPADERNHPKKYINPVDEKL